MVKKIKQKTIVPMRHGNIVFNLISYILIFITIILLLLYIFFNSTQATIVHKLYNYNNNKIMVKKIK